MAEYYQVEISGMAVFANCPDCAALDGAYIMGPMQQIHIDGDPVNCSDGMLLATICADSDEPGFYGLIGLQFYHSGGAFHLLVNLQSGGTPCGQGGGQPSIEWEMDFAPSAPDCLFLDEFGVPQPRSLTWITNGVPTTERCDGIGDLHRDADPRPLRQIMCCVFQASDDPDVHRCGRCGFVTAPTRFLPEKVRRQCQSTTTGSPGAPSLVDRVRSYHEARERWIAAGRPVRSEAEMTQLHAICQADEHFSGAS